MIRVDLISSVTGLFSLEVIISVNIFLRIIPWVMSIVIAFFDRLLCYFETSSFKLRVCDIIPPVINIFFLIR